VIPNSLITTVANQSADYSVATVNVSVDFSAHPDKVTEMLKEIAIGVRNDDQFKPLFVADPQVLGVDAVKGSELIFPVVFKTIATKQYAPVREFKRRVRLALEENNLLPGDPYRVYSGGTEGRMPRTGLTSEAAKNDPTTIKPQEANPFGGGS
jgi:small conductance mechanosensitive channel